MTQLIHALNVLMDIIYLMILKITWLIAFLAILQPVLLALLQELNAPHVQLAISLMELVVLKTKEIVSSGVKLDIVHYVHIIID